MVFYTKGELKEFFDKSYESIYLTIFSLFTFTLFIHLSGIIIIIVSEYFPNKPIRYNSLGIFPLFILDLLSGVFGNVFVLINVNISVK